MFKPILPAVLYLPDTMASWPWERSFNPYHEEVKAASNGWLESFMAFTEAAQIAFNKSDCARFASLAYPDASKEHLRTGCNLMNLIFVFDEYTEVETADAVREIADVVIHAMNYPDEPRPDGEIVLGEMARQFWGLAIKTATPTSQKHMLEGFTEYLESVVQEARDRDTNVIRTIESYFENRRQNIGARLFYVPLELNRYLPDHVFYHPVIQELSSYISDLLIVDNDIVSYNKEQATGDARHNILTVVMHQLNIDFAGAMEWAVNYHSEVEKKFLDGLKRIPSWGTGNIDQDVEQYIHGLGNWPRANDCWNFESHRYFGSKGPEIYRTRMVPLLPKVLTPNKAFRRENVIVPHIDDLYKISN